MLVLKGELNRHQVVRHILSELHCSRSFIPLSPLSTVDVELTNYCNQKCEFCPTGLGTLGRPKGMMGFDTFQKLANHLPPETRLQFAGYGEPFLNHQLEAFLGYAGSVGFENIEIYSNFGAIREKRIRQLLDYPFKRLVISLDAMSKEAFKAYKGCDQFDRVFNSIRILSEEAKRRKSVKQELCVQMAVTKNNIGEVQAFKDYVTSIGLIAITKSLNTYVSLASDDKVNEFEVPELSRHGNKGKYSRTCPWVWGGMLIFWNGDVTVCCEDPMGTSVYGNIHEKGLRELVNGARADFRRQYFNDPGKIKICRGCHDA